MAPQVITCRAAVCWGPKEPLVIEQIQVDPPQAGEVRVKVLFASLCRSDITYWLDKPNLGMFPRIFGHEAVGVIESVGEGVVDLKEGDCVLLVFTGECKECMHCKSSKSNLCAKFRVNTAKCVMTNDNKSRFSIKGRPIHYFLGSAFSEYTVVEYGNVVKINPDAPLERVCLLSCGVTAGLSSVWNVAKVEKGSTVAIFGLGTVGMAVAHGAKSAGASRIIGVDTNLEKAGRASSFGVTDFLNPSDHAEPIHQVIKDMTDGGVDYSFECVGNAQVVETALLSCHDGWGMAVIVGVAGERTPMSAHPGVFLYGRTLTGSLFGGLKPKSQLPAIIEMYMRKEIELDSFVTHELEFSQINEAFKLMQEGKSLRCVMKF